MYMFKAGETIFNLQKTKKLMRKYFDIRIFW